MTTATSTTTQVHRVFIKATPEAIWEAITSPEWSDRYGYGGAVEVDLRPGGVFKQHASQAMREFGAPDVAVDGEVVEADPPNKLVLKWRMAMDPENEGFTRLTYVIDDGAIDSQPGISRLTVTHELEGAPNLAAMVAGQVPQAGGGWPWILSSLKTLLETGAPLEA